MKVNLNLFASLTSYLPPGSQGHSCAIEVDEGTSVQEVLEQLKIPADMPRLVFLNGIHAKGPEILKEGDRLTVFPPIAGG